MDVKFFLLCLTIHVAFTSALPYLRSFSTNSKLSPALLALIESLYGRQNIKISFGAPEMTTPETVKIDKKQEIKVPKIDNSYGPYPIGATFGPAVFQDPRSNKPRLQAGPLPPEVASLGDRIRQKARNGGYRNVPVFRKLLR